MEPVQVEYEPSSGLPGEYCEFLPKADFQRTLPWLLKHHGLEWVQANCQKFKDLVDGLEGLEGGMEGLAVEDAPKAKTKKPGKSKKEKKKEIVLERSTRNKRKCITSVMGLDLFGIKLGEAAKMMGKKFACGSSVVKEARGEQIDVQGDFQEEIAKLILGKYGEANGITEADFVNLEKGKKSPTFG
mmetsp:Transcript_15529/g.44043  ORF Transcript_15529/g.44043 Transcript_15529/m.44043 type:complete len:186 (+) Transcript_15529:2-559(+)